MEYFLEISKLKEYLWEFLAKVEFSKNYSFDLSDHPKWEKPPVSCGLKNGRWKPLRPDGLTVGNNEVFGAIGVPNLTAEKVYEYYNGSKGFSYSINPSQLSLLVGPKKKYEHCKVLFNSAKYQDFFYQCEVFDQTQDKRKIIPWRSLSQAQDKKLFRIRKTPIAVSEINDGPLDFKIIDFCPKLGEEDLQKFISTSKLTGFHDIPILCRYVIISNNSNLLIKNTMFGCGFINYGTSWQFNMGKPVGANPTTHQDSYLQHVIVQDTKHQNEKNAGKQEKEGEKEGEKKDEGKNKGPCFGLIGEFDSIKMLDDAYGMLDGAYVFPNSDLDELPLEEFLSKYGKKIKGKGMISFNKTLKQLKPTESVVLPFILIPSESRNQEWEILNEAFKWDFISLLENTFEVSVKWSNKIEIKTTSENINDLIDSLLNHLKLHSSPYGLHTGSVYYSHNSAFIRDNYQLQRGLMKAGRLSAGVRNLDFFSKAIEKSGLRNSYNLQNYSGPVSSKELRVELPAYLCLAAQNLLEWTGNWEGLANYYEMIRYCMDISLSGANGLFILNSDEQWIWSCYVDEISYYLDNSLLMIAANDFATHISDFLGTEIKEKKQEWQQKQKKWAESMFKSYYMPKEYRFAVGMDCMGTQDTSLIPTILSRPVHLHMIPILEKWFIQLKKEGKLTDKYIARPYHIIKNNLDLIWEVMSNLGTIRAHSKTCAVAGNTPAYYLYAVSDLDLPFKDDLFELVLEFPNCTGAVNEIHDIYNKSWGTERRRVGDSGILLEGILHYLFGIVPERQSILFDPHAPFSLGYGFIRNIKIKNKHYLVKGTETSSYYQLKDKIPSYEFDNNNNSIDMTILDKYMFTNEIVKEIQIMAQDFINNVDEITQDLISLIDLPSIKDKYISIVKSDLSGKIRYYPNIFGLELGLKHEESMIPPINISLLEFIPPNTSNLIKDKLERLGRDPPILIEINTENLSRDMSCHILNSIFLSLVLNNFDEKYEISVYNMLEAPLLMKINGKLSIAEPKSEILRNSNIKGFKELIKMDEGGKYNFTPHSFLKNLEDFITKKGSPNILVFCDEFSKKHAIEVLTQIAILKWQIYPLVMLDKEMKKKIHKNGFKSISKDKNIIFISRGKDLIKNSSKFEPLHQFQNFEIYGMKDQPYSGMIYIPNNGHVFKDTHSFCEKLGIYLTPTRNKAISMHPFGKYRLSDQIGFPADTPFRLEITSSIPINIYVQGKHYNGKEIKMEYDPSKRSQGFKPKKPYCSFYTMQPFAPMEVAAGGFATGRNCIRFIAEANVDTPLELTYKIYLDQTYHPIQLIGGQRERILDPTHIEKKADGSKVLITTLHPGRDVHEIIQPNKTSAKKRSFQFTFGRFPHI